MVMVRPAEIADDVEVGVVVMGPRFLPSRVRVSIALAPVVVVVCLARTVMDPSARLGCLFGVAAPPPAPRRARRKTAPPWRRSSLDQ